ncbi:MAG: HAMP domain-containing sensor histidine kinase [Planctomycetota bacterium]|jgi:signal transduction histidine kinase|nr:HAMP domain-containing sensor histidine kinase [Planctomycetota bacterium]
MARGLRTRTRLLASFLGLYVALAVVGGAVAWQLLDQFLAREAADRARVVAQLSRFLHSDTVRGQLEELTGYQIEIHDQAQPYREGTVQVTDELGQVVAVDYRNAAYASARKTVLLGALGFLAAGTVLVAAMSYLLASDVARPLEYLAAAARRLGQGEGDASVPQVGTGEVADLAAELEAMRQRLQDLDARNRRSERLMTLGTFTAVIAHEIRNPLSAVKLSLQLMARKPDADASLPTLLDELERLDLIVDELLAFSRGITVERQTCALHEVAADVCRLLKRQADHAGVALELSGAATVQADPARLRQLLLNLLLNAIQAQHQDGGSVRVTVRSDGFEVCDDGPGVAPDERDSLFDAFATGRAGGTGLGLHIARSIAEAHGARLQYRDKAQGACFELNGLDAPA